MELDGIKECLCLILEPHYSYYSVMGCEFLESGQIKFKLSRTGTANLTYSTIELMKSKDFRSGGTQFIRFQPIPVWH